MTLLNKAAFFVITLFFVPFIIRAQTTIFFNEVNYLASGADKGLEISAPGGTDLTGYTLYFLDPSSTIYATQPLGGIVPTENASRGDIWIEVVIMNVVNGSGVFMTDDQGDLVHFISYGGALVGSTGITAGITADNIGVQVDEESSLQLTGCGTIYPQFVWNVPGGTSPGDINEGQSYDCAAGAGIFPVELLSFSAEEVEDYTYLRWETAQEMNNHAFEIRYSIDGISYEPLTTVSSTATNGNGQSYSYLHMNPKPGINYYQLIQIDEDGIQNKIGTQSVFIGQLKKKIAIHPNPATNHLQVQLPPIHTPFSIQIINEYGQFFYAQSYETSTGNLEINISDFPAGTYIVQLKTSYLIDYQLLVKL